MNGIMFRAMSAAVVTLSLTGMVCAIVIETVPVEDVSNEADTTGYGSVNHPFNIGKYEVTAGQYTEFLKAVAGNDTNGLYNPNMWSSSLGCKIQRTGAPGSYIYSVAPDYADRPVNYLSFWDSCRFANWLHNGQPTGEQGPGTTEDGAYTLTITGITNNTVARNPSAQWAVTSEDEWYKAAYYKGGSTNAGYFLYPTSSNTPPGRNMAETTNAGNNANYYVNAFPDSAGYLIGSPYYRTEAGEFEQSQSPYGTFDQAGNVQEWTEGVVNGRGLRGGSFFLWNTFLPADHRHGANPSSESYDYGFRVSQVPEPAMLGVAIWSGISLLARRRNPRI